MPERKRTVAWIVLGIVVFAGLVYFGRPLFMPTDPEDAAMKVRRPVPAVRRAPGQIAIDSSTDPNAAEDPGADPGPAEGDGEAGDQ